MFKRLGPGFLVTSAFIGPGTVVTLSLAGARFGYQLLWVLAFSIITTLVLQEMAARLGFFSKMGLTKAFYHVMPKGFLRILIVTLIVCAILLGCVSYEVGNIAGAATGLSVILPWNYWSLLIGILAAILLLTGRYRIIQSVLMLLVFTMSAVYLWTAFLVKPDLAKMAQGLFVPSIPEHSLTTILAVIGTTIVPYNVFLHAQAVLKQGETELKYVRLDSFIAILLGGVISAAILVSAYPLFLEGIQITHAKEIAEEFAPLLGNFGIYLFALGLFSAGLTSAITAPLAAAFVMCGAFQKEVDLRSHTFRFTMLFVLTFGVVCSLLGYRPIRLILLAQMTNGFILPVVALLLLYLANQKNLLKENVNGPFANVIAMIAILVVFLLSVYQIYQVF